MFRRRSTGQALVIEPGAVVGDDVTFMPGCTRVGRSATVLDGAVVSEDVPDGVTVGGNPARPVAT